MVSNIKETKTLRYQSDNIAYKFHFMVLHTFAYNIRYILGMKKTKTSWHK